MLNSMTADERANPDIIDISRRRRITAGAGVENHEVNKLMKMFEQMRSMMQRIASISMMDRIRHLIRWGKSPE